MPLRDFLMDANNDLAVVANDFAKVGGTTKAENLAAVAQGCKIRVQLFLGENWLDQSKGVDWKGQILVKNPDKQVIRALIAAALTDTPDVIEVTGAELVWTDRLNRKGSISYAVNTVYGPVSADVVLPEPGVA